ncbi:MAG: hypothetical protein SGPRY_012902, partial [Prymnesium sp.]
MLGISLRVKKWLRGEKVRALPGGTKTVGERKQRQARVWCGEVGEELGRGGEESAVSNARG